jgi:hypothetical protein
VKTGAQVDALLRMASELSAQQPLDAPRVEMSSEAIDLRLRQASELSAACLQLGRLSPGK